MKLQFLLKKILLLACFYLAIPYGYNRANETSTSSDDSNDDSTESSSESARTHTQPVRSKISALADERSAAELDSRKQLYQGLRLFLLKDIVSEATPPSMVTSAFSYRRWQELFGVAPASSQERYETMLMREYFSLARGALHKTCIGTMLTLGFTLTDLLEMEFPIRELEAFFSQGRISKALASFELDHSLDFPYGNHDGNYIFSGSAAYILFSRGCALRHLKAVGFTLQQLKAGHASPVLMFLEGVSLAEMKDLYSLRELKDFFKQDVHEPRIYYPAIRKELKALFLEGCCSCW